MRTSRATLSIAAAAIALIAVGCGPRAQLPPPTDGTPAPAPAPTVTPAEQCELFQAGVDTAGIGLEFVKIKDQTARAAAESALTLVETAAADYCDAVAAGASPDALQSLLRGYRAALADFRAKLRAARLQSASVDDWLQKADRLARLDQEIPAG